MRGWYSMDERGDFIWYCLIRIMETNWVTSIFWRKKKGGMSSNKSSVAGSKNFDRARVGTLLLKVGVKMLGPEKVLANHFGTRSMRVAAFGGEGRT